MPGVPGSQEHAELKSGTGVDEGEKDGDFCELWHRRGFKADDSLNYLLFNICISFFPPLSHLSISNWAVVLGHCIC